MASAWVAIFIVMTLTAVALPLPARIGLCVCAATACVPCIRSVFLLGGPDAVRALQWSDAGLVACIGPELTTVVAKVAAGSFRIGRDLLVLRLQTCDGTRSVLIDGGRQEIQAFRRLCRHLESRRHVFPDKARNEQVSPS
jgi:hypothetical protein